MNSRERILAAGLITVILLSGGGFLFRQAYLVPLHQQDANILAAEQEVETKRDQLRQAVAERSRLEHFRELSLPADVDLARREYEKYLSELMRQSGFEAGSFSVTPKPADARNVPMVAGKKPVYTRLTFTVLAHADLASLVKMLTGFYRTGLLHQIKNLAIQKPLTVGAQERASDLDIILTIEALIVGGAGERSQLLPNIDQRLVILEGISGLSGGPAGLALATWAAGPTGPLGPGDLALPSRHYEAMAAKNIFLGPPPAKETAPDVEVTRYVHLTDISNNGRYYQAFLFDRYNNQKTRLRSSPGFDRFRILGGGDAPPLDGRIVQMGPRDLVFQSSGRFYSLHVGESLNEALRQPLSQDQVESLTKAPAPTSKPDQPRP